MAKVYLDTNIIFDLIIRKPIIGKSLINQQAFYSPLSVHILFYANNLKVPSRKINRALKKLQLINLTKQIITKALDGPTSDLEDNIQLYSASQSNCDFFLTNDKKLLTLVSFGKTKIVNSLDSTV